MKPQVADKRHSHVNPRPLPPLIRHKRNDNSDYARKDVHRHAQQVRPGRRVPELADDAGQEEREGVERAIGTGVEQHPQPCLPVLHGVEYVPLLESLTRSGVLVVRLEASDNNLWKKRQKVLISSFPTEHDARRGTTHGTLSLGEELGVIREVLDDPEARDTGDDGGEPLEDEDPRPRGLAGDAVHVRDGSREQAAEGARNGRGGEKERCAEAELGALVPARVVKE
jgi:hypothetical protein